MKETKQRLHYLDWLRVVAFGLLFLFHAWKPFDHFEWHIKNTEQSFIFDVLTIFTHGWRMHLIFLVSGAGTWFALRSRKNLFVVDRLKRLIIPFVFGIMILIPPQRFYEWVMFHEFEGGYLAFLSDYPAEVLSANMGVNVLLWFGHLGTHLWYLPYLFVMTIISIPLLKNIQNGKIDFSWLLRITKSRFGIFLLVVPMIVCRITLKPIFQHYTGWADFFIYIWPFLYGFVFMAKSEFIEHIKDKTYMMLTVGIISSGTFMYLGVTDPDMADGFTNPVFGWIHYSSSIIAMFVALSWVLFFFGLFAKTMDFNHKYLVLANHSILPVYILHQTLIIVFGYYILTIDQSMAIKYFLIVATAISASYLLYFIIKTNDVTRFIFGLKSEGKSSRIDSNHERTKSLRSSSLVMESSEEKQT